MRQIIVAVTVALAACAGSSEPLLVPDEALIATPAELTLRIGEETDVPGSVMKIQLSRVVEDSRCPIDAICVWAGNAVAELGVRAGMGPTVPLQMNTTLEPHFADWQGVRLTLLELQPAPRAGVITPQSAYTARVRLEPIR